MWNKEEMTQCENVGRSLYYSTKGYVTVEAVAELRLLRILVKSLECEYSYSESPTQYRTQVWVLTQRTT